MPPAPAVILSTSFVVSLYCGATPCKAQMRSWRSYAHEVLCLRHLVSKWLGIAVNKKKKIPGFPTFFKLGVGSTSLSALC